MLTARAFSARHGREGKSGTRRFPFCFFMNTRTFAPHASGRARDDDNNRTPSWRNRLSRYGALALWLAFISYASTGTFAAAETSRIIGPLLRWLFPAITEQQLALAHFLTRKLAHFLEYAVLALLAARAFIPSTRDALRRRWFWCALLVVAAYALLDEYHQSFVPTRTASVWDSLIDTAGGATALLVLKLWRARRARAERRGV
jgi:VanZ family protein